MKIDSSVKATGSLPSNDGRARSAKESPKAESSNAGSERVELSSLSSRMLQMEEAISNAPVVDTAKVDEIKQAMSEGRFKVNTEKVADGLIESVRQMLSAQQVGQDLQTGISQWFTPAKGINRVEVRSEVVDAIADVVVDLKVLLAGAPAPVEAT